MQPVDTLEGMHRLFRHDVLGEGFNDFSHPKNYCNVPILRRDTYESASINYKLLSDKHHLLHKIIVVRNGSKGKFNNIDIASSLTKILRLAIHQNQG